jgi:SAM-dependent methyltransferase
MGARTEIAFAIAKRRMQPSSDQGRASQGDYRKWREGMLEQSYRTAFDESVVKDRDVLDFGCGTGELSFLLVKFGARSAVGIDLTERDINAARAALKDEPIRFVHGSCPDTIDLPSESVDVVACFDVMEHIMQPEPIMREWLRVLRPGGRVLIHWQPYYHPWGHHAVDYLPIPWAHVLLSHRERSEVIARLVDCPDFPVPWWDMKDGQRVNRFRQAITADGGDQAGFLNELTMGRFERMAKRIGFRIDARKFERFAGPAAVRWLSGLFTKLPGLREFFTANAIYTLVK